MQLNVRSNGKTPSIHCRNLTCDNVSARLPVVEDAMIAALNQWLADYMVDIGGGNYTQELQARIEEAQSTQLRIAEQIKQEDARMSKAYEMLELGVYSPEEFTARRNDISQRKNLLQEKSEQAAKQERESEQALTQQKDIIPKMEQLVRAYPNAASAREKNEMLKSVVERIDYEKLVQYDDSSIKLWVYPLLSQK